MSDMGKTCAKNVCNLLEKSVGALPHVSHKLSSQSPISRLLPRPGDFSPGFIPRTYAALSTVKIVLLTDRNEGFSPQSTPPITTTITYINRRGIA